MAKNFNIDDIDDDDFDELDDDVDELKKKYSLYVKSIDNFLENSKEINRKMKDISLRTRNIDNIMENSEKIIEKIESQFKDQNLYHIKQQEIHNKILLNLRELAEKGVNINELTDDYEAIFKISLDILNKSTVSNKKKFELENKLFNEYMLAKKYEEKINARRMMFDRGYSKVANFFEKFSGPFSNVTRKFFETRRENVISNLAESKSGGIFAKVLEFFGKFPVLFGGIAVALGLIASRLMKLVGAEINLNSEIVKSTGLRAASAKKIESQIASSRDQLKVFYNSDIEEAQKKASEGAGAILRIFGSLRFVTAQRITDIVSLSEKIGISTEESAKYFSVLEQSIGMSRKEVGRFGDNLTFAAEKAGQSLADITRDIATNAEFASIYTDRTGKSLLAAAIQARAMGTSLKEVGDFSKKFTGIDEAFENIRDLNLLIGKQYNPFEFIAKARFGTHEQQTQQLERIYKDIIEQQKAGIDITKDAYKKQFAANILTGGNVEQMMAILNRIKGGATLEDARKALEATRKRDEARKDKIASYAKSLGILEIKTPTELLLAKILNTLDNAIRPAVDIIANVVKGIFEFLLDPDKFIDRITREGTALDSYRDFVNKYSLGLIDVISGRGTTQYVKDVNEKRHEKEKRILTETLKPYKTIKAHALGGIVSKPSIVGEAGPEVILPLTGPGKETFTKPFINKVSLENNKEVISQLKELNNNIKELLKKPIALESKLIIDGRQIARSLTETALTVG